MTILKMYINPKSLTAEDKTLLAEFINANLGQFLSFCKKQHSSKEQLNRCITFVENNTTPIDDNLMDVDL